MKLQLLAFCGLYCGACGFKLARETENLEHLRRMPERYDPLKQTLPEPCPGCRLEQRCGPCAIRDCATAKGIQHCGRCPSFPCARLIQFSRDGVPHHAESIRNLEHLNAIGLEAWLAVQEARWTGPCACRHSWYLRECQGRDGHRAPAGAVQVRVLDQPAEIEQASRLAAREHARLRALRPFLPAHDAAHFRPRIARMVREGRVLGLMADGQVRAFLGGFIIENFRHAGRAAYCPDWCHAGPAEEAHDAYRALYRELAPFWKAQGAHIHAIGIYASAAEALEAFALTGFGRIMLDAARPVADLLPELEARPRMEIPVGPATAADAASLAGLSAALATHLEASPVFLRGAAGMGEAAWREWLQAPRAIAFQAAMGGAGAGFIKAQEPQMDVTDAVNDPRTLAINGAFVHPAQRGRGIGRTLLLALARHAHSRGMERLSVDFETLNPEGSAFWGRYFRTVSWGLERRT